MIVTVWYDATAYGLGNLDVDYVIQDVSDIAVIRSRAAEDIPITRLEVMHPGGWLPLWTPSNDLPS